MRTIKSQSLSLTTRARGLRSGASRALAALITICALLGGCVALDEQAALGSGSSALCAAPGTPVSFAAPDVIIQTVYPDDFHINFAIPADFNGDGLLDTVFLDGNRSRVWLAAGTGSQPVGSKVSTLFGIPYLYSSQGGAPLDFDGDGDMDIAILFQGGASLVIALNDGAGTFSTGPIKAITGSYGLKRAAVGDFDGDGRPDVALTSSVNRVVRIVLNTAAGLSLLAPISTGNGAPWEISAGDLNLDGDVDLVVGVSSVAQPIVVLQGNGDGTFTQVTAPAPMNQGANGSATTGLVLGDFDGDGRADAAYVQSTTRAVHMFRNTSAAGVSFANEVDSWSGPQALGPDSLSDIFAAIGDFDADGRLDIAVVTKVLSVGSRLHVLQNDSAPGSLSFASAGGPWLVNSNGKTSTQPRGLVAGSFNVLSCEARADILFSSSNTDLSDWSVQFVANTTE